MKPMLRFASTLAAVLPLGLVLACAQDEGGPDLESDTGGLSMDDEAPLFGADREFDAAAFEAEVAVDDPMAEDVQVTTMIEAPDAAIYAALVVWGQTPHDRDVAEPRVWSGSLSVNRGAIVVRRTVGFEEATDQLAPRTDPAAVEFTSRTRPAADGLALTIVDPEPTSADPLTLTYAGDDGTTISTSIADLLAGPVSSEADALGNRMIAAAMRRPVDVCDYGFVRGRWRRTGETRGRLIGQVANQDGELIGHVRGHFGERASGKQVFFGKYINLDGGFRGLFAGHYGEDRFRGRWLGRAGERGVLGGHYLEAAAGAEVGGLFIGRWAEKSCNLDLGPDEELN